MICPGCGEREVPEHVPGKKGRPRKLCEVCSPPRPDQRARRKVPLTAAEEAHERRQKLLENAPKCYRENCDNPVVVPGDLECALCKVRTLRAAKKKAKPRPVL